MKKIKPDPGPTIDARKRDSFLGEIIQKHYTDLLARALQYCRQYPLGLYTAADLVHDLYIRLDKYRNKTIQGYERIGIRYLYKMLKNLALGTLSKAKKKVLRDQKFIGRSSFQEDGLNRCQNAVYLAEVISGAEKQLKPEDVEILRLYRDEYTFEEIGQVIGRKPSFVNTRFYRHIKPAIERFRDDDRA